MPIGKKTEPNSNAEYNLYSVELEIGDIVYKKLNAIKHADGAGTFNISEDFRNLISNKNNIGNAIFHNHIIQIDFEKQFFRII